MTQVETFECTETASEPIEASEEAARIIETLGCSGQAMLLSTVADTQRLTRCPFRLITADEDFTYRVLCPQETPLKDYRNSPVPLRVLQIAELASSLGMFEKFIVWDRVSAAEKDPVLVATRKNPTTTWQTDTYILARWGSELETFSTLYRRAVDAKRAAILDTLRTIAAQAQVGIQQFQSCGDGFIVQRGAGSNPYAYNLI